MTPSSCSTAPSSICSQLWRSMARAMMARLRMRDVDMRVLRTWADNYRSKKSGGGGQRFLLGKRAVDLIAHQLGQLPAQALGLRRKRIARPRNVDRHDGLDPARPRREHDDPVRKRDRLIDVVR